MPFRMVRASNGAATDWIHYVDDKEITEIELAMQRLEESGLELATLLREDFPLPTLAPRFSQPNLAEVLDGRGFVLLGGLPVHCGID